MFNVHVSIHESGRYKKSKQWLLSNLAMSLNIDYFKNPAVPKYETGRIVVTFGLILRKCKIQSSEQKPTIVTNLWFHLMQNLIGIIIIVQLT